MGSAKIKEKLPMIKNRSRGMRAAVVAGVMALLLGPAAAAQAAVVAVNFNITEGSLSISGATLPLPGGNIAGDWDDVTGDFTGTINIPTSTIEDFEVEVEGIGTLSLDIDLSFTEGAVVGTVPPDGSTGSVTTAITVGIFVDAGLLVVDCSLGPVNLTLATVLDAATGTLTATASDFAIPGANCVDPSLNELIDGGLGLPVSSGTALSLTAVLGELPPPTTTTTVPSGDGGGESGGQGATAATPRFTG